MTPGVGWVVIGGRVVVVTPGVVGNVVAGAVAGTVVPAPPEETVVVVTGAEGPSNVKSPSRVNSKARDVANLTTTSVIAPYGTAGDSRVSCDPDDTACTIAS